MILRNTLSWLVFRRGKLTSPLSISASTIKKPRIATIAVFGFGFLALAAALRLVFLDWGLPYVYHPDEPVNVDVIRRIIADLKS